MIRRSDEGRRADALLEGLPLPLPLPILGSGGLDLKGSRVFLTTGPAASDCEDCEFGINSGPGLDGS